jgi:hypothetical protein
MRQNAEFEPAPTPRPAKHTSAGGRSMHAAAAPVPGVVPSSSLIRTATKISAAARSPTLGTQQSISSPGSAAFTHRVRLGVGCMASFPVRHPLVFAYQWATLDLLSNGRMLLAACTGRVAGGASAREGDLDLLRLYAVFDLRTIFEAFLIR